MSRKTVVLCLAIALILSALPIHAQNPIAQPAKRIAPEFLLTNAASCGNYDAAQASIRKNCVSE